MKPKVNFVVGFMLCSIVALAAVDVDAEILKDLEFFQELDLMQSEVSDSDSESIAELPESRLDEAEIRKGVKE